MPLTVLVFWITYVGGVCAAIFNPLIGVALYVIVYHLNPETQWWGASVQWTGLRTSFTVALATGIGMIVRWPQFQHGARQFPLPMVLTILFGVIALGSLGWGVDLTERGQYQAEKFAKSLIFLVILIRCVRTPTHYHVVILSWLIGVLYLGYEARGGVGQLEGGRLSKGLGGGDFAESSDLSVHLVATLPLIGAMFFMARTWWGRTFALVTGALAVDTLIMTRTRNALIGLVVMGVALVFSLPRGYRAKGVLAIIVGAFLAVQLTDPEWWSRMATITHYDSDPAAAWRFTYWHAALDMVNDYPLGVGLGNFHHFIMNYIPGLTYERSAHNTLIACLAELGWLGLFLFLTIIGVVFWRLGAVRRMARALPPIQEIRIYDRTTRFHLGWHAIALRAALLGYLGCGMFTTRLFSHDFWLLVGFSICLHNVSKHMLGEQEQPAEMHTLSVPASHTLGLPVMPGPACNVPADR